MALVEKYLESKSGTLVPDVNSFIKFSENRRLTIAVMEPSATIEQSVDYVEELEGSNIFGDVIVKIFREGKRVISIEVFIPE